MVGRPGFDSRDSVQSISAATVPRPPNKCSAGRTRNELLALGVWLATKHTPRFEAAVASSHSLAKENAVCSGRLYVSVRLASAHAVEAQFPFRAQIRHHLVLAQRSPTLTAYQALHCPAVRTRATRQGRQNALDSSRSGNRERAAAELN
jgi:hypothetical protein